MALAAYYPISSVPLTRSVRLHSKEHVTRSLHSCITCTFTGNSTPCLYHCSVLSSLHHRLNSYALNSSGTTIRLHYNHFPRHIENLGPPKSKKDMLKNTEAILLDLYKILSIKFGPTMTRHYPMKNQSTKVLAYS